MRNPTGRQTRAAEAPVRWGFLSLILLVLLVESAAIIGVREVRARHRRGALQHLEALAQANARRAAMDSKVATGRPHLRDEQPVFLQRTEEKRARTGLAARVRPS